MMPDESLWDFCICFGQLEVNSVWEFTPEPGCPFAHLLTDLQGAFSSLACPQSFPFMHCARGIAAKHSVTVACPCPHPEGSVGPAQLLGVTFKALRSGSSFPKCRAGRASEPHCQAARPFSPVLKMLLEARYPLPFLDLCTRKAARAGSHRVPGVSSRCLSGKPDKAEVELLAACQPHHAVTCSVTVRLSKVVCTSPHEQGTCFCLKCLIGDNLLAPMWVSVTCQ